MRIFRALTGVFASILFSAGILFAQGVGTSGVIRGTVIDPTGASIPKATIVAEDPAKGIRRTAMSDDSGAYELTGLPPAKYQLTVKISGFQTQIHKDIEVSVGQTVIVDFSMKLSSGSELVEVTTEPPVVETERGHLADTVSEQYIKELPIDRRDYLTFTLLMPGVSDSTHLAGDQDFRVKQTPQSGLSFYGSNGRGNSVTVDGGEANDDSGGVRLTLSQEAVQEFQINRSNYSAELGGASGAAINIVSKTAQTWSTEVSMDFSATMPWTLPTPLPKAKPFSPATNSIPPPRTYKAQISRIHSAGSNSAARWDCQLRKTRLFFSLRSKGCGRMRKMQFQYSQTRTSSDRTPVRWQPLMDWGPKRVIRTCPA